MEGSWWKVLTKCAPLEMGMANHFSILALRTHEQYEKTKNRTLKEELPRLVDAQYAAEESGEITPKGTKRGSQSENNAQLWM